MAAVTAELDFSNIIKSVISLFEIHKKRGVINYTYLIYKNLQSVGPEMFHMIDSKVLDAVGAKAEFRAWLSMELNEFFTDFAKDFFTGNKEVDDKRRSIHHEISKKCKFIKFKKNLAWHICETFYETDAPDSVSDGRELVAEAITDYINDLYF